MPKETKKFINPLLRPSAEPKAVVQPRPEPEVLFQEEVSQNPSSVDFPEQLADRTEQAQIPLTASVSAPREISIDPVVEIPAKESTPKKARAESDRINEPKAAVEVNPVSNNRRKAAAVSSSQESSVPEPVSARSRYTPVNTLADIEDYSAESDNDFQDATTNDTRTGIKRRKNIQPFESTHERITLWMDKQLKQQFEDLAYRRELSKTALINEAVAELLQKYEAR